jgi:hypothetical protein
LDVTDLIRIGTQLYPKTGCEASRGHEAVEKGDVVSEVLLKAGRGRSSSGPFDADCVQAADRATGGEDLLEELMREVVGMARRQGVAFGSIQVLDSKRTVGDVKVVREKRRREGGGNYPATEGRAGEGKGRSGRTGQADSETGCFYGYKMHASLNAGAETITSIVVKKDGNREVWIAMKDSPAYRAGRKERYKVERKYGEAKENHGLRRCRHLGWIRYAIQAHLTAIVRNLKRMVKVLAGVSFKGEAVAMP